jgi:hypothetical protein
MGADTSLTQLGNGREHVQSQSRVGCECALNQLRVERQKKHNPILGYDFRVMAFKWKIFLENHDLSVIICDFYLFINTYNFQFI